MEENAGADGLSTSASADSSSLAAVRVNRAAGAAARTSAATAAAIEDCVPGSHRERTHCQVAT